MSKTAIWWIVGAVVVIGGIVIFTTGGSSVPGDDATDGADNEMVADAFSGSGSIKCDYNQEGGLVGTAYVKGGKIRIEGTVQGGKANVIYGNGKVYSWGSSNGYDYAIVVDAPEAGAPGQDGMQDVPSRADIENQFSNGSANCERYSASDSFFTPPPSVKFQSMTELRQMAPAGAGPTSY